jgi:signal transduction histidine kinase
VPRIVKWYRSLYWRIALGVVAFLAAMLAVQAVLFVWVVSQSARLGPGQSPQRIGRTIALDLTNVLERDPAVDLEQYIREQYAQFDHPFFVMLTDRRVITSGTASVPEPLLRLARVRLDALSGEPFARDPERFGRGGRMDRFERGAAAIVAGGRVAGVVVVPPQAPFRFLLSRYAPVLTIVAGGVLLVGAVLTSVMIFGPARRRLRELENAARTFGAGDLSARAPERGGDEIAAVARAFNTMADDLAARAEALAAADRLRRQLLADVSHELNTPVTAMRGYLETLAMSELQLDPATRARYLAIVGDETARLERLIGDLLELARLEGGGGTLRIEAVPVADLFERVRARHERSASEAGVSLDVAIAAGADTVAAARDRLEQALQTLAANAIRFAPAGTTVRLAAARSPGDEDRVRLSVEDEGPGIAPEHLPHVFDRFYKVDWARTGTVSGSGLGLSIVKAIVERHGGRITAQSRPGRTIFELTLPGSRSNARPADSPA